MLEFWFSKFNCFSETSFAFASVINQVSSSPSHILSIRMPFRRRWLSRSRSRCSILPVRASSCSVTVIKYVVTLCPTGPNTGAYNTTPPSEFTFESRNCLDQFSARMALKTCSGWICNYSKWRYEKLTVVVRIVNVRELKKTTTHNGNFTKQKVWWGEQWLCTCIIIHGTFLCRPLQNNNVKWPSSASSTERGRRRLIPRISIWNRTPSPHIQLKHVFRAIGAPYRSRQSRISVVKYKFPFNKASSSASSSSLLELPITWNDQVLLVCGSYLKLPRQRAQLLKYPNTLDF